MSDEQISDNPMNSKLVLISGRMKAGKTTLANYIAGEKMLQLGIVDNYSVNDDGQLVLPVSDDHDPNVVEPKVVDLNTRLPGAVVFWSQFFWPHLKLYNFADLMKAFGQDVMGLSYESCYGSGEAKMEKTPHLFWENTAPWRSVAKHMSGEFYKRKGEMSSREFLEWFGTVCRELYPDCWVDGVLRQVINEQPASAIICDCRYKNEVEKSRAFGGRVIRLMRNPINRDTFAEVDLDDYKWAEDDFIVDNTQLTQSETFALVRPKLVEWGILS